MNKNLFEQAKGAKSAKELLDIANANGVTLSEQDAEKYFAKLNRQGELADEELDNVAGGGCKTEEKREYKYVGRRFTVNPNRYGSTCKCGGKIFVVTNEGYNSILFGCGGFWVEATCEQCASKLMFDIGDVNFI